MKGNFNTSKNEFRDKENHQKTCVHEGNDGQKLLYTEICKMRSEPSHAGNIASGNTASGNGDKETVASLQLIIDLLAKDLKQAREEIKYLRERNNNQERAAESEKKETGAAWKVPRRQARIQNKPDRTSIVETANRFACISLSEEAREEECSQTQENSAYQGGTTGKKIKMRKIRIFADSHGRNLSTKLADVQEEAQVEGTVKPGAPLKEVIKETESACKLLNHKDFVVIMGGTNNIGTEHDGTHVISALKKCVSKLYNTNVIIVNIPKRHDINKRAEANKAIMKCNVNIANLCNRFNNVRVVDVSTIGRFYHTRHGLHLNSSGKDWLVSKISEIINEQKKPNVIPLQGN